MSEWKRVPGFTVLAYQDGRVRPFIDGEIWPDQIALVQYETTDEGERRIASRVVYRFQMVSR